MTGRRFVVDDFDEYVISRMGVWRVIAMRIKQGEYPSDLELASALRTEAPTSPAIRKYLAERFEGGVRRPANKPPLSSAERLSRMNWAVFLRHQIRHRRVAYRDLLLTSPPRRSNQIACRRIKGGWKIKDPGGRALEKVAARHRMTADQLRDFLRKHRPR
jgi:hypothetical protein